MGVMEFLEQFEAEYAVKEAAPCEILRPGGKGRQCGLVGLAETAVVATGQRREVNGVAD